MTLEESSLSSLRRMTGAAAATLAVLAGGVTLAPAASAATRQSCNFVNSGYLCLSTSDSTGDWRASFLNQGSTTKRLQFTLHCKQDIPGLPDPNAWYESGGAFDAPPGQVKSYVWARWRTVNINETDCQLELKDINTGVTYYSPWLHSS
ncbi:hypothetical protein [Kitasatospora indigofera]|uniref:hypothetical protein n=1 Tax=Kitasatospora indigofera TaxID=67307 RepID=UPI0033ABB07B